jgi:hypothetical protein
MNNTSKYLELLLLMIGVLMGFVLSVALLIIILKLLSVVLFTNKISENIYHYCVIIIPYLIFFAAYYYLYLKVKQSKNIASKTIASFILIAGCLLCATSFILLTANFLGNTSDLVAFFNDNSGSGLVIQIAVAFLTAMVLAFGDPKEKDWIEKN